MTEAMPEKLVLPALACESGHVAYGDPGNVGQPCPSCGEPLQEPERRRP